MPNRRTVLGTGAAGLVAGRLTGAAYAGLDASNVVAWHQRNTGEHKALVDKWAAKGFRTVSLSIYGSTGDPRYAAVMVKRASVHTEHQFFPRNQAGIQADFDDQAKKGLGPYIICATGPKDEATFAACFRPMANIPLTRLNQSQSSFDTLNAAQHAAGNILGWVDVFGDDDDPRFAAIWVPNPGKVAWSTEGFDIGAQAQQSLEDSAMLQQRFDAVAGSWGRPAHVAMAPGGKAVELFVDSTIGAWASRAYMTADDYQAEFDKQSKAGRWPIRVSARGSGGGARFAAIFTGREETDPRTFRSNGPVTVAGIDAVIQDYMAQQNLRGCALAIANGAQLVYAKGYTYAEAGYPDITPLSTIRQASISKTFTGTAIWRYLQDHPSTMLSTTVQSIMNLKQPDGSAPKDKNRWNMITLKHLLESDSGLPQWLIYGSESAAAAFNGNFPATYDQLLSYATSLDTTGAPGDPNNSVYGNFDYLLLGQILKKLTGAASYEAAIKSLLLDPLHMTHTHLARSRIKDQPAGEARHHMKVYNPTGGWKLYPFEVRETVRDNSGHLAATHYGNLDFEMFSGAGGLSSCVVDMARLGAMFSVRSGNPVLKPEKIDAMMDAIIAAGSLKGSDGKGSHGYYGLDWAYANDKPNHVYTAQKGGWLPGQGTILQFTTGGFTYAFAINGNAEIKYDWLTPISTIAQNQTWSSADLFATQFGMPSLLAAKKGFKITGKLPALSVEQVQSSMTQAFTSRKVVRRKPPVR